MDKELLDILVCPRTKKKLVLATDDIINILNKKINSGKCHDISGEPVKDTVKEGLFQPEDKTFYLIRDGIPLLIYDNGIKID
ncbi:MAG: hypothetical protein OEV78_05820 [Spirochaetia bacterium]|nr:hypothetical protein [Spirochaetia bacterium]